MVNRELKHMLELYAQKRFSQIGDIPMDKMLKIDSETVTKVIKKNHSYLICTCQSSGKTGHHSLCRHKQFFIMFPLLEFFNKHLDKLIKRYKSWDQLKGLDTVSCDLVLDDLNNLKRIK